MRNSFFGFPCVTVVRAGSVAGYAVLDPEIVVELLFELVASAAPLVKVDIVVDICEYCRSNIAVIVVAFHGFFSFVLCALGAFFVYVIIISRIIDIVNGFCKKISSFFDFLFHVTISYICYTCTAPRRSALAGPAQRTDVHTLPWGYTRAIYR